LGFVAVVSVPLDIDFKDSARPGAGEKENKENIVNANVIGGSQNVVHTLNDTNPNSYLSQRSNQKHANRVR
jgi:hypothetical protein